MKHQAHAPSRLTLHPASAVGKFVGFKPDPDGAHYVRQPQITSDALQSLRDTRAMLSNMAPEQVLKTVEWYKNMTFLDAVGLAKQEGKLIISNRIHDNLLMPGLVEISCPVWTGTMVIYTEPKHAFGNTVVFVWGSGSKSYSISFNVPPEFQNKRGYALVVEHPDFELVPIGDRNYQLVVPELHRLHLIEKFPSVPGWYMPDVETGVPHGRRASSDPPFRQHNQPARELSRLSSVYIGPIERVYEVISFLGDDFGRDVRHNLYVLDGPTERKGVGLV